MGILMLMILRAFVTILSYFFRLLVPLKQTWIYMVISFLLVKWYVKELIIFQYQFSLLRFSKNKYNNTISSMRKRTNCKVNVIWYYSQYVVPSSLWSISQKYCSSLKPHQVQTEEHNNVMDEKYLKRNN